MTLRDEIVREAVSELEWALGKFPPMASAHEGWAILREEVDELWDAVKAHQSMPDREIQMRAEAIQVAAMALRFVLDVCPGRKAR
jgi:hypothetical protein